MIRNQKTIITTAFHPAMLSNIQQLPEGVQLLERTGEEGGFAEIAFLSPAATTTIRRLDVPGGDNEEMVHAIWVITQCAFSLSEHIVELLAGTEEENLRFFENIKSKLTTGTSELEQAYIQAVAEHHAKLAEEAGEEPVAEAVEEVVVEATEPARVAEEATEVKTEQ